MPKDNILKWIKEDGESTFSTDGEVILCKLCGKKVNCERKFQLEQHCKTTFHLKRKEEEEIRKQALLTSMNKGTAPRKNLFYEDLCRSLIAVSTSWNCVDNAVFKAFLEKYTNENVPCSSTLRKTYLPDCYNKTIEAIRSDIGENHIWMSVDETIDVEGQFIANLIVGKMTPIIPTIPHLLACQQLEKTNFGTITRFVNNSLRILWPDGDEEKVLLLVTDAAPYMTKAGNTLKTLFPNMVHVTCAAHGLHRVSEKIRDLFPNVNEIIAQLKKVFSKAPNRIVLYKDLTEGLPLPPEPIVTRWGMWIEAALFYAKHLDKIKDVVKALDENEAASIKKAKELLSRQGLEQELTFIEAHYCLLPSHIKRLEANGLTLVEALANLGEAAEKLKASPGQIGLEVKQKVDQVFGKNSGLQTLAAISSLLEGRNVLVPEGVTNRNVAKYLYAPITSCDVERSFSVYKMVLTDRRHSLTPENLGKIIVTY